MKKMTKQEMMEVNGGAWDLFDYGMAFTCLAGGTAATIYTLGTASVLIGSFCGGYFIGNEIPVD